MSLRHGRLSFAPLALLAPGLALGALGACSSDAPADCASQGDCRADGAVADATVDGATTARESGADALGSDAHGSMDGNAGGDAGGSADADAIAPVDAGDLTDALDAGDAGMACDSATAIVCSGQCVDPSDPAHC